MRSEKMSEKPENYLKNNKNNERHKRYSLNKKESKLKFFYILLCCTFICTPAIASTDCQLTFGIAKAITGKVDSKHPLSAFIVASGVEMKEDGQGVLLKIVVNNSAAEKEIRQEFEQDRFFEFYQNLIGNDRRRTQVVLPGQEAYQSTMNLEDIPFNKISTLPIELDIKYISGVQASKSDNSWVAVSHLLKDQPGVLEVLASHIPAPDGKGLLTTHNRGIGVYVNRNADIAKFKSMLTGIPTQVDFVRLRSMSEAPSYQLMLAKSTGKTKKWLAEKAANPALVKVVFTDGRHPNLNMSSLESHGAKNVEMLDGSSPIAEENLDLYEFGDTFQAWMTKSVFKKLAFVKAIESFEIIKTGTIPKDKIKPSVSEPLVSRLAQIHSSLAHDFDDLSPQDSIDIFVSFGRKMSLKLKKRPGRGIPKVDFENSTGLNFSQDEFAEVGGQFIAACQEYESIKVENSEYLPDLNKGLVILHGKIEELRSLLDQEFVGILDATNNRGIIRR